MLLPLLLSCSKHKVFESFVKFEDYEWEMNKIIKFDVSINDTSVSYNISIPVRHIENYPYDGLLINFTYYTPNGEEHTKNYKLNFRDVKGNFIGDGSGDIWDESVIIMKNARFNTPGIYKFEIVNNMPKTPVMGIMELGLCIEKAD